MPNFHIMAKPAGPVCNFNCQYCYYLGKRSLFPKSDFRMDTSTLESFTRQYIEAHDTSELTFTWQGGEPTLMGLDFFRSAVALQEKYAKPGMKINNAIQTNAALLDHDWCQFFHAHDFLVGVSLDGPQPLHDAFRQDHTGAGTFDRVIAGIDFLKQNAVEFNILTCVHAANQDHPLDVYHFLRDEIGAHYLQFIPIVEKLNDSTSNEGSQVSARSVGSEQYGHFLNAIFDEWLKRDVGQVFVQIFDVVLGIWAGYPPGLCIFSPICGDALVLEHNGDIFACDHFVEPQYLLGNINDGLVKAVSSPPQVKFGNAKSDSLPAYCHVCHLRFICNGGCPKNRICRTPDGEQGLNYLCEGYKLFLTHTEEPMKKMVRMLHSQDTKK